MLLLRILCIINTVFDVVCSYFKISAIFVGLMIDFGLRVKEKEVFACA